MAEAVTSVAANSFFAIVEACDEPRFADLSRDTNQWWILSVQFTEAADSGVVSCTLPDDLAHQLFDAFTGSEPGSPVDSGALVDLLGEFANMICGTWLTRLANHQTFSLSRPAVLPTQDAVHPDDADARVLLVVNDLPLAVEVRVAAHVDRSAVATEA
jgi:chemotaxis protein CheY-P-specific phosphatase CheC